MPRRKNYDGLDMRNKDKPAKRNPQWPQLDFKELDKEFDDLDGYERAMVNAQCETMDDARAALRKKRYSDDVYAEKMDFYAKEARKDRFIRTHYNDLEADNYERQEQRMLNG